MKSLTLCLALAALFAPALTNAATDFGVVVRYDLDQKKVSVKQASDHQVHEYAFSGPYWQRLRDLSGGGAVIHPKIFEGDWVQIETDAANQAVNDVIMKKRPTSAQGFVSSVSGNTVTAKVNGLDEHWNVLPTTVWSGSIEQSPLRAGEEINVQVYDNNDLASVHRLVLRIAPSGRK